MGIGADAPVAHLSRKLVLGLSVGSLVVLVALAWLAVAMQGRTLASLRWTEGPLSGALAFGLLAGVAASLAVTAAVLYVPALESFRAFLHAAYAKAGTRRLDMLLVAVNAGVGEELFFRGVLQPLLGIGWTSLVFALLHSAVPRTWARAGFALYVFGVSLALGVLYEQRGLAAVMAAHAAFNLVFLVWSARALTALDRARGPASGP
jgi:membrane protease YdiL (CAAX protease family)